MLNELFRLADTLTRSKVTLQEWHKDFTRIPKVTQKYPCFRIWLQSDGSIADITLIHENLAPHLRKYGNNQGTFPALNLLPLYRITDEAQKESLEEMKKNPTLLKLDVIKQWCITCNWHKGLQDKLRTSLHDRAQTILTTIRSTEGKERDLLTALIEMADVYTRDSIMALHTALEKRIFAKLEKQEEVRWMLHLLFHPGDAQKTVKNDPGRNQSVILDVAQWKCFEYPVASEHVMVWLNAQLLRADSQPAVESKGSTTYDALGIPFVNPEKPLPKVKLDGFEVSLRTMFGEQHCQLRYGYADDASYPIAPENRSRVKGALEWLASGENEGITWCKIDKEQILFAYPSEILPKDTKWTALFGTNEPESTMSPATFLATSKDFMRTMQGISPENRPEYIQVFVIAKLDKARAKLVLSRKCTPKQLIDAAESWQTGASNLPAMKWDPHTPFPLDVPDIINRVWKQDGSPIVLKKPIKMMRHYQGVDLLLNWMPDSIRTHYLQILLSNSAGLIKYVGNTLSRAIVGKATKENMAWEKNQEDAQDILTVLGIFLEKGNIRKEHYMKDTPFLLGQLLKVSDALHAFYCRVVRNGDVPPQLAGNGLFVAASERPASAIGQLGLRMNPYIAWAKQYSTRHVEEEKKESWRARWYLGLYEKISDQLASVQLKDGRLNDEGKAQLFIGYLASLPKLADPANPTPTKDTATDHIAEVDTDSKEAVRNA